MQSTVIGGAMLPHAPQFFTLPDTEDKAVVAKVREVAADIGERLRALKPDLWIIFSNDHAEQFFHTTAPPFTIHVGGEATGEFAGRKFHWQIPSEIAFELVRQLYRQNFDPAFTSTAKIDYAIGIPLTHIGHTEPVLPIYVNAYLPPQPTMERCYSVRPGGGAHRDRNGAAHRHPGERRHVAFPRHRPLLQPGIELGQEPARQARLRKPQIADRLRRGRARRDRQHRAALLGLRRRRARRAQARRGVDGPELAPRLRLARLDRRARSASTRRTIPRSSRSWSSSPPRCMRSPMTPTSGRNTSRTRRPTPTSSSCRRTSARR